MSDARAGSGQGSVGVFKKTASSYPINAPKTVIGRPPGDPAATIEKSDSNKVNFGELKKQFEVPVTSVSPFVNPWCNLKQIMIINIIL